MPDEKVEELETYELKDIEIMAVGKWNNTNITKLDLENMVENFRLFGDRLKAPLKLGHDAKQKLAQADGLPAVGWIKDIRLKGEKLIADFTGIPKKVKQLIGTAYGRFSAEILFNLKYAGNIYKRVLRGVALLGEDTPAVNSITDIINLYSEGKESIDLSGAEVFAEHILNEGDENMEATKELQEQLEAEKKQSFAKDEQIKELQNKLIAQEENQTKTEVYSAIDKGIADGKIAPAIREKLAALALAKEADTNLVHSFTENNEQKEVKYSSKVDIINGLIEEMPQIVTGEETTVKGEPKEELNTKKDFKEDVQTGKIYDTGEVLHKKALEFSEKNNVEYDQALIEVSKEEK